MDDKEILWPVHTCAMCPRPIRPGLLMCALHWRLVPGANQQQVYRTWARFKNLGGGKANFAKLRMDYESAVKAALSAAQSSSELRAALAPARQPPTQGAAR